MLADYNDIGKAITLLQISDLHTRKGHSSDEENLRLFGSSVLPAIRPDRVIVTGDVVKAMRRVSSRRVSNRSGTNIVLSGSRNRPFPGRIGWMCPETTTIP